MNWLKDIEKAAKEVLNVLGEGYTEAVYEEALAHELRLKKIPYDRQRNFEILYKGYKVGVGTADLIINPRWCNPNNREIVLEVKRANKIQESYKKQAQVYMISLDINDGAVLCFSDNVLIEKVKKSRKTYEQYVSKPSRKVKKPILDCLKESAQNVFEYFGTEFTFRDDLVNIFTEAIKVELRLRRIDFSQVGFDVTYKSQKVGGTDFDFIFKNNEVAQIEFYDKEEKIADLKEDLKTNRKLFGLNKAYLIAFPKSEKGQIKTESV